MNMNDCFHLCLPVVARDEQDEKSVKLLSDTCTNTTIKINETTHETEAQ